MEMNMAHPVPICATVSRRTGEVRIEWVDDRETQIRFGRIMNQISRMVENVENEKARKAFFAEINRKIGKDAKAEAEALEARRQDDEMKGCENAPARIAAGCATR